MNLEVVEVLTLGGEGAGGQQQHWSRHTARPRYSLSKDAVDDARSIQRFTCFDVAERVEAEHEVLFAGRTNGAVVFWRMVARNLFGGANKNDRVEEILPTSTPHKGAVTCLTHTRPGTYGSLGGPLLFSGSTDHTIKAWNAWEGASHRESCLQTMAEHRGGVTALAFAGDTTLISTARDGSVRLWRPQRGRKLLRFPFFCCVKCLSVYPVVRGSVSQSIGKPGAFLNVWPTATCVAGGEEWTLYCGDNDGTVSVFQRNPTSVAERLAKARKRSDEIEMEQIADSEVTLRRRWSHLHSLAVTGLVLVPEHNFLLSMGNDGACRVLDYLQGSAFMTIESDGGHLFTSVAWDLAHEQLVLADSSGVVQVWNTYTGSLLLREQVAKAIPATGPRWGHASPALLGFHSSRTDGLLYGMSPSEGCFFRWKMVKVEGYALLGLHNDAIVGLGFQGGKVVRKRDRAASTIDATAACHKLENDKLVEGAPDRYADMMTSQKYDKKLRHSATSSSGRAGEARRRSHGDSATEDEEETAGVSLVVLSACIDGSVRAWETLGMSEKYRMEHPVGEEVISMLVLPGGSILATGLDSGMVRFWRLDTGAGESFKAHDNAVSALAACRDRRGSLLLASAGFGGAIALWTTHAKDGVAEDRVPTIEHTLNGAHGGVDGTDCEILCLAFVMADVPLLVSAGNDLALRCWRFWNRTYSLLATLEGHKDAVETLVVDGLYLLSGGCDGTVRVWNVSSLALKDDIREESNSKDIGGQIEAMSVGVFEAHPNGVAGMAVMYSTAEAFFAVSANPPPETLSYTEEGGGAGQVEGLLVTFGKAEGVVKIWDYTYVGEGGSCGRLIAEICSNDESLFTCVACTQDANGEPLLFAGTTAGSILQLATGDASTVGSSGGDPSGVLEYRQSRSLSIEGDDRSFENR